MAIINHKDLGESIEEIKANVRRLIQNGEIQWGGNRRLKIYGTLHCDSGKKMKIENRVFFRSIKDALSQGYRPCGYCMREEYKKWKERNETHAKSK